MIQIQKLVKSYSMGKHQSIEVLKGIDLHIQKGEMICIMGSSGSGKSTLLNIIGILDSYDSGSYHLDNKLITNLSEKKSAIYRNHFLGFVFQSFNLINYKNALENVALPLYYQGLGRRKRNKIAIDYMNRVGLGDRLMHMPSELSGGQKQRVAIARALIGDPKVILADEPTGALDSHTTHDIMDLLKEIHNEGKTIIIVSHERDIAAMCDKTILLVDGKIVDQKKETQP